MDLETKIELVCRPPTEEVITPEDPQDIKNAVVGELARILEPVRRYFESQRSKRMH